MILKQKMAEKHSLHSKHFRVNIGCTRPNFYTVKKSNKCFQPAENPTETLVTKAKKPKKHDVERTAGWYV